MFKKLKRGQGCSLEVEHLPSVSLVLVHSLAWQKKNVCDGYVCVRVHVCAVCVCCMHAEVRGRHRVLHFITLHISPVRPDLIEFRGKEMGSKSQ